MKIRFLNQFILDFDEKRFLFDTYYDFYEYSNDLIRKLHFYADYASDKEIPLTVNTSLMQKEIDETLNSINDEDDFFCAIEYFESFCTEVQKWSKNVEVNNHNLEKLLKYISIEMDFMLDFLYFKTI